ncbi:MAG: magnesium/cobalt efflux protein, partial [Shewanella sp.]
IDGIEFKVINADTRRLIQLRVKLPDPNASDNIE